MENFEVIIFTIFILGFFTLGFNYIRSWEKLRKILIDENLPDPLVSQEELNKTAKENYLKSQEMMWRNAAATRKFLTSYKTDNVRIQKAIQRFKLSFYSIFLLPILIIVMIIVYAINS